MIALKRASTSLLFVISVGIISGLEPIFSISDPVFSKSLRFLDAITSLAPYAANLRDVA